MRQLRLVVPLFLGVVVAACGTIAFDSPGLVEPVRYAGLVRYFAEFCALSQIKQRLGQRAGIRGDIGGHAVFYLQGVCRAPVRGATTLMLCDEPGAETVDGVGISMNAHYRNAKWVAVPGREFFLHGGLAPGAALTEADYADVQADAKRLRLFADVEFHETVFDDLPPGVAREDWKYEVSVATDYAIGFGRGRFCARVPVNRAQLAAMVAFLNEENAPYRDQGEVFRWRLFQDNCIHLAHNALAAAGVWPSWATGRPWLLAVLNFPVPRNELVNLLRRTGDPTLLDPAALHADPAARHALLHFGQLPLRPGAVMEARPLQRPNAVYETALKLIFYDEPVFGPYQGWFDALQGDPRRHDLAHNLAWVAACYRQALRQRRPLAWWEARRGAADRAEFAATYQGLYALLAQALRAIEPRLTDADPAQRCRA